jgi:uncharacterized DUF497 family protein
MAGGTQWALWPAYGLQQCSHPVLLDFEMHVRPRLKADHWLGRELRQQSLSMVDSHLVLLVAHTVGEDNEGTEILRIISARKADSKQRKCYEQDCETRG